MPRYDRIRRGYNSYRNTDRRVLSLLIALLDLPPGSVVADIDAGTGNYANGLAAHGFRVKTIEPSDEMRKQAVENEQVDFIAGTAEAIPLESNSVDGVVSTLAMHHFTSDGVDGPG